MCNTVPQCLTAGEFLAQSYLTQLLIHDGNLDCFSTFLNPPLKQQKGANSQFLTRQVGFIAMQAVCQQLEVAVGQIEFEFCPFWSPRKTGANTKESEQISGKTETFGSSKATV